MERDYVKDRSMARIVIRVYYEDTDFSARVYHASYLRFLERGRTEWLRGFGIGHREIAGSTGIVFAVRSLQIEYLAPALMDDLLEVETQASKVRGASSEFHQRILRDGGELVRATVLVVAVRDDRPTRIPEFLRCEIGRQARRGDASLTTIRERVRD
jgi:acyl-CoA thioester hydrolase